MDARCRPRASERNNVVDLRERQAKPASLTNEGKQLQHVVWIAPVTGFGAEGGRQDAASLIQP